MSTLNPMFAAILDIDGSDEMKAAVEKQSFWVVAIPCFGGTYSVGMMGDDDIPNLLATKEQAEEENQEMIDMYAQQIKEGERDEDDEWEGEVLEARWDGESEKMSLYLDGSLVHTEDWKSMAGL